MQGACAFYLLLNAVTRCRNLSWLTGWKQSLLYRAFARLSACPHRRPALSLPSLQVPARFRSHCAAPTKQSVGPRPTASRPLSMLRSRISRRVIAEQHIHLAQRRPGFIGVIATDFSLREAVDHAARRTQQARARSGHARCCQTHKRATHGLDASARAGEQVRACNSCARCCQL